MSLSDQDGLRIEAAEQSGFEPDPDHDDVYSCEEKGLLIFARRCERKGIATVATALRTIANAPNASAEISTAFMLAVQKLDDLVAAIDAEVTVLSS